MMGKVEGGGDDGILSPRNRTVSDTTAPEGEKMTTNVEMKSDRWKPVGVILAALGAIDAGYLTYVHYAHVEAICPPAGHFFRRPVSREMLSGRSSDSTTPSTNRR